MITYFVLTLYCLTCSPIQVIRIHNIPVYDSASAMWADLTCKTWGDILSGDYRRRNMSEGTAAGEITASKDWIVYTCTKESGEF